MRFVEIDHHRREVAGYREQLVASSRDIDDVGEIVVESEALVFRDVGRKVAEHVVLDEHGSGTGIERDDVRRRPRHVAQKHFADVVLWIWNPLDLDFDSRIRLLEFGIKIPNQAIEVRVIARPTPIGNAKDDDALHERVSASGRAGRENECREEATHAQ